MTSQTVVPTDVVQFVSRHRQLRLVRRSGYTTYFEGGGSNVIPEIVYEFKAGLLEVAPGTDVLADGPLDADGNPTEQDAIAWLRWFETRVNEDSHFYELTPVAPDPTDLLGRIGELIVAEDADTLEQLWFEERDGWKREPVLGLLTTALEKLRPEGPKG